MALSFRPCLGLFLLLSTLLPTASSLAPLPAGAQAPQPSQQPQSSSQPTSAPAPQLPAVNQLRDQFMNGCMTKGNDPPQRSYCNCTFNALMRRYNRQQYVSMDNLIIRGGPAVGQFAKLAWEPEFVACRTTSPLNQP
jgi:hypothetical protein